MLGKIFVFFVFSLLMASPKVESKKVLYHSVPSSQKISAIIVQDNRAFYLPSVSHVDSLWGYSNFNNQMEIKDSVLLPILMGLKVGDFPFLNIVKKCHCVMTKNSIGVSFNGESWYSFGEVRRCDSECSENIQVSISNVFFQLSHNE